MSDVPALGGHCGPRPPGRPAPPRRGPRPSENRCMRRAILLLLIAAAASALDPSPAATAPAAALNGIGLIDYSRRPTFKVGDWVKYRMSGKSELGMTDNYDVTLLIA